SQLRHLLRTQGRNLHAEFIRLLPSPPQPIRVQRWSARRVGLWAAIMLLVVLASAYSASRFNNNDLGTKTLLHIDNVSCDHLQPMWLEAQSVPSASLVPCVRSMVVGWRVA